MSACCWRCAAKIGGCRGVGFAPVHTTAEGLVAAPGGIAKAPSFDSLVRPVSGGPLARRLEPARVALSTGVRGVGAVEVPALAQTVYSPYTIAGGTGGALAGAAAGAAMGSFVPGLGTLVGAALGGLGGALGVFGGSDAAARRRRNMALYQQGWDQAKYVVLDQVTRLQRRLDLLDRDLIALDKTLAGLDGTVRSAGSPSSGVLAAVARAKDGRRDAASLVDELREVEDSLSAAAAAAVRGEQSGQTQLDSPAQVALDRAKNLAATVDSHVVAVSRSLGRAVDLARSATTTVNRWLDTQQANAQAMHAAQQRDALLSSVAAKLATPPPGFVFDERGGLVPVQGAYAPTLDLGPDQGPCRLPDGTPGVNTVAGCIGMRRRAI